MTDYLEDIDATLPDFGEFYDELPLWSAPFALMLLERVPLDTRMTVVDVGAGTGFLTLELAQRCGPSATVIAVDPWAAAMHRLRRKLERNPLPNVRLIEGDAAALPLPEASVDVVVSNLGINNFDNADGVLATCARVLKPGGRLLLTTNLVGHLQEFYAIYRQTLLALDLAACLARLDEHIAHRATVESVGARLARSGLAVSDATTGAFRMRFADGSALLRHRFMRLGFVPAWKAIVPPETHARFFPELERRLNLAAAQRGELALTVPTALIEARR